MKKFLLMMMLCVTTVVGAWGQGSPQTIEKELYVGDVIYWNPGDDVNWSTTKYQVAISNFVVNSGDEQYVTAVYENGSYKLTGIKKTTTPATITFTATNSEWGGGSVLETIECTAHIEVKAAECTITITPTPSSSMALGSTATYNYTATWKKGETPISDTWTVSTSASSSNNEIVKCTNNGNIYLEAIAGGQATITVKSTYNGSEATESFDVTVVDPSIATSIDADDISVAYGYSETIDVQLNPATATNFTSAEADITGVTCTKVSDIVNGKFQLKVDASGVAAAATGTITITAGSVTKTIYLNVIAPVALKGISLDPSTDQTIAKGATLPVSVVFDPADAANKNVTWNIGEYDNDFISFKNGIVTGKKHGNAVLTATSEEENHTASLNIKVTEPFEGTLNVPTSPRLGATGLQATLNFTNGATSEDYTVEYTSSNTDAVEVNASTGALTLKAQGEANITAVLTPTSTGEMSGFTTASFESAKITVGAPITATWTGSINTELELGSQNSQVCPTVEWSETIANSETTYTIISDDETVVKGVKVNENLLLGAIKEGTANITISAEYGVHDWTSGSDVYVPLTTSTYGPFAVTVSPITGELTVTPSEDIILDVTDDPKFLTLGGSWSDGKAAEFEAESSNSEIAKAELEYGAETKIKITPVSAGTAVITAKNTWTKALNSPFSESATMEKIVTLNVTVKDKTAATSLSVAPTANVAKGYSTVLDVTFAPETANGFTCSVTGNSGVSAELSADFKKLTISATAEASTSDHATVTITPKAGSTAPAATVDVTVVEPVAIESITLVPSSATPLVGEKVTLVPTFNPENPASKHLTWSSSNDAIAKVDENGVVTAIARGAATITATSDVINGNPAVTATATITVKEELAPAVDKQPKATLRLGETYNSELTLTNSSLGTFHYESDNTDVISVTDAGTLTANKIGTANITVTINPTADGTAANYVAWTRTMPITVIPAEFGLTLAAEPIKVSSAVGGTVNVTPTVTLNGAATDNTAYSIEYTLEGATSGVTINNSTGQVTIPASTPVQQFAVVATLTPDDKDNYKGAVGKAAVLVEGTASAGITLSKSKVTVKDAYGNDVLEELVIVNVPTPGAFGSLGEETITSTIDETTLQMLKDAKNVKVTGLLANSDVQKLVLTIGTGGNPKYTSKCEYIDMGEATMTEAITTDGKKCSLVGDTYYALESAKTVVLPRPAIGVTNGTVLPANTNKLYTNVDGNSMTALTTLVIPEGWTELADCFSSYNGGASYNGTVGVGNSACLTLTSLTLPNSLEKIGAYAFSSLQVKTLYMPTNLQRIAKYAFDPCTNLQDVYFTGPAPKYVDTFAFGGETQMCNNTVDDNQLQGEYDPVITRHEYHKLDVYACILHYPSEYEEDYIDTSRKYTVIPADMPYSKGNSTAKNTYYLPGWSDAKIAEVNEKRLGAMTLATYEQDFGVKDKTYGHSFIWPSQSQMATGYLIARAGYQWSGDPLRTADQYDPSATYENGGVDKRGLYQFIVGMGNAPKDQKKWVFPTQYEKGKWYTFSVPFDMSVEQIKKVFGPGTQVCRLSKVVRDTNVSPNILKIEFRYSVMEEGDGRPEKTTYVESELDASGNTITNTYTQSGIRHHWPYMIKPGGSVDEIKENDATFYEDGSRVLPDYEAVTGILRIETVTAVDTEDHTTDKEYMFCPILMKGKIKKNSYVLSRNKNTGAHEFIFYKGVNKGKDENGKPIYEDGGTASANTAYVQLMHGQADFDTYFPTATINQSKVSFASIFGDFVSEEDILSDIEKIEIVCGNDNVNAENNKIYTINGVLVNGKSLAPGLYIKNGKKFIVK